MISQLETSIYEGFSMAMLNNQMVNFLSESIGKEQHMEVIWSDQLCAHWSTA